MYKILNKMNKELDSKKQTEELLLRISILERKINLLEAAIESKGKLLKEHSTYLSNLRRATKKHKKE